MIYLDSAATSFQKPVSVGRAMGRALAAMSSPGRGGYEAALLASDTLLECRLALQRLFHVAEPENVVFTLNATHALNIAIRSLVPPGGRVALSGWEHNAVTRPLHALGAEVRAARGRLFDDGVFLEDWEKALGEGADAAVCTQVSNVFGWALPIREAAELCRERGVPLIVDASQGAGVLPLDAEGLAYAAMPGHKGLLGPQGTGVLLCGEGQTPEPILQGGTGRSRRRRWGKPFPAGASPCGQGSTARPWPTRAPGPWRPELCGPVSPSLTGKRRWRRFLRRWRRPVGENLEQTVNFSGDFLASGGYVRYNMLVKGCPMAIPGPWPEAASGRERKLMRRWFPFGSKTCGGTCC